MNFGSVDVLFEAFASEEDIYTDEINDGIASCAEQQAKIWAVAANEADQSGSMDTKLAAFVADLVKMTQNYTNKYTIYLLFIDDD